VPVPVPADLPQQVARALAEDVGAGDLTAALIPADRLGRASVITREPAIVCGIPYVEASFAQVDERVRLKWQVAEGDSAAAGQLLLDIEGPARALLTGERTALNFLQRLSGIATLTLILAGQAFYKETTGREGVIDTGGVEWMRAGCGVWHAGGMYGAERIKGFQLWVAMPPELELTEAKSQYLAASDFQRAGPARVIAGEYDGVQSIVESPTGITYLDVHLKSGERWTL